MMFLIKALVVLGISTTALAQGVGSQKHSYVPARGFVPDSRTAVKIAIAVLAPIYGVYKIQSQEPFIATLKDGVWTVEGNLDEGLTGGVAVIEISMTNGMLWSNLPGHLNRWKIHPSRSNTWRESVRRSTPA